MDDAPQTLEPGVVAVEPDGTGYHCVMGDDHGEPYVAVQEARIVSAAESGEPITLPSGRFSVTRLT